jgi:hypothetical protein
MANYRWLPSHRALPDGLSWLTGPSIRLGPAIGPADHVNPVNIRAIRVKKVSPHCFSSFSWRAFIDFRVDEDGRRVRKTRDGGYMHLTPYPLAGSRLPQMRVVTGEL